MAESEDTKWLTVRETAERLGKSEEAVRRMIRAFELPASRMAGGARAPWMVNAHALARQQHVEAEVAAARERLDEARVDAGYGEEFFTKVQQRHGAAVADQLREVRARHDLFDRVEREMDADTSLQHRFETLDEEQRFEEEAQELARRIRRAEQLRDRALELLDEDD